MNKLSGYNIITKFFVDEASIGAKEYNDRFSEMGIKTDSFIINSGGLITIWAGILALYPLFFVLRYVILRNVRLGSFESTLRKIEDKLRWGLLIRGIFVAFIGIFLSAVMTTERYRSDSLT